MAFDDREEAFVSARIEAKIEALASEIAKNLKKRGTTLSAVCRILTEADLAYAPTVQAAKEKLSRLEEYRALVRAAEWHCDPLALEILSQKEEMVTLIMKLPAGEKRRQAALRVNCWYRKMGSGRSCPRRYPSPRDRRSATALARHTSRRSR